MSDSKAINMLLIVLLAFGLITSFLDSVNLDLDSDTVVPGLVAMEFVNHGDFQFTYPVDDPYWFTDIFTFYFLPQVISDYNPMVLRLTAFVVFLLVVAVFSYLIYKFSNLTSALLFAALFANLQPGAIYLFLAPEYHVGSLLFAGLFLLLFHTDIIHKLPFYAILVLSFVVGLIIISDSIIIAFFILPYLAYCIYNFWIKQDQMTTDGSKKERALQLTTRKNVTSKIANVLVVLVITTISAYELKMNNFFLNLHLFFITTKTGSIGTIIEHLTLFVNSLILLLNDSLHNIMNTGVYWYDLIIATIFILVIVYSFVWRNEKANYLYLMFLLSTFVMFVAFVFTTLGDGGSSRFLIFIAVSVFAVIALAYKPEKIGLNLNTMFLLAVIILILATMGANIIKISGYDYQPNKEDYALISYLEKNNLTFGYSDINSANKLIYLSKEKVLYPKITLVNNKFIVEVMLTTPRWYELSNGNGKLCLLVNKNDEYVDEVQQLIMVHKPNNTYYYEDYTIYQLDL